MKTELYFDKVSGLYYFDGEPECFNCKSEILEETGTYIVWHPKRLHSFGSLWCQDCLRQGKLNFPSVLIASEIRTVHFGHIPITAFVVPTQRMETHDTNMATVFSIAEDNKGVQSDTSSCITRDDTRLAGRESWDGVQIGKSESQVEIESGLKTKLLSADDVHSFLIGMKESEDEAKDGQECSEFGSSED
jgi:hypothetical protein